MHDFLSYHADKQTAVFHCRLFVAEVKKLQTHEAVWAGDAGAGTAAVIKRLLSTAADVRSLARVPERNATQCRRCWTA